MAQRVQTVLTDDLDGTELADGEGQTITFAVGRSQYEIDLSDKNLGKFYDALKPYTDVARKVGRSSAASSSSSSATRADKDQTKAMREWAQANGYEVSARGRIKQEIQDAFHAAN